MPFRIPLASLLVLLACASADAWDGQLQVDVYRGGFASVNSFIFSNGQSQIVLDVQRKTSEAKKLADLIRAKGVPLTHIFISHGHTDHFTGMAYLHEQFPDARIAVSSEAIKREIREYAIYMDSGGETGAEPALEPALRPKSAENPTGFDYEGLIQVLPKKSLTLDGGGTLEISDDYPPTESLHTATVYVRALNALFLADLGYNGVHLWMGDDITLARVAAWRAELLKLKSRYSPLNPQIFPGHGAPTDLRLFDDIIRYIDDYVRIVKSTCEPAEAVQKMKSLYPTYEQADFFLKYSVENHVRGCR